MFPYMFIVLLTHSDNSEVINLAWGQMFKQAKPMQHVVWGLLSSNAWTHRNLEYPGHWKDFWMCILFGVETWLFIKVFSYTENSQYFLNQFSLCLETEWQTTKRSVDSVLEKRRRKIFPKFKFYRFKLTLNFSVSYVCVLCCAFFIEGSRLDLYSVLFSGINCGCVPLRWCVPQFTFSTNLTGEDFCVRTVLEGLFACSNSIF